MSEELLKRNSFVLRCNIYRRNIWAIYNEEPFFKITRTSLSFNRLLLHRWYPSVWKAVRSNVSNCQTFLHSYPSDKKSVGEGFKQHFLLAKTASQKNYVWDISSWPQHGLFVVTL